jgi:hypothetical protein
MERAELASILMIVNESEDFSDVQANTWWHHIKDLPYQTAQDAAYKLMGEWEGRGKPRIADFKKVLGVVQDKQKRDGEYRQAAVIMPVPTEYHLETLREMAIKFCEGEYPRIKKAMESNYVLPKELEVYTKEQREAKLMDYLADIGRSLNYLREGTESLLRKHMNELPAWPDRADPDACYFRALRAYAKGSTDWVWPGVKHGGYSYKVVQAAGN